VPESEPSIRAALRQPGALIVTVQRTVSGLELDRCNTLLHALLL
jgi:hypothetical protein